MFSVKRRAIESGYAEAGEIDKEIKRCLEETETIIQSIRLAEVFSAQTQTLRIIEQELEQEGNAAKQLALGLERMLMAVERNEQRLLETAEHDGVRYPAYNTASFRTTEQPSFLQDMRQLIG